MNLIPDNIGHDLSSRDGVYLFPELPPSVGLTTGDTDVETYGDAADFLGAAPTRRSRRNREPQLNGAHPDFTTRSTDPLTDMDLDSLTTTVAATTSASAQDHLADHPLLRGLLLELPPVGSPAPEGWAERWLDAARAILELLYGPDAMRR